MNDVTLLLVVVGIVAVAALALRATVGRSRPSDAAFTADELRQIGAAAGRATCVLFTAPGCGPCVPAARVVHSAAERHGAAVVTVDVTEHPHIAEAKGVWRAPTLFIVDAAGRAVSRTSGVPRPDVLDDALRPPVGASATRRRRPEAPVSQ